MKLIYNNTTLLFIQSTVIKFSKDYVMFKLHDKVDNKDFLYDYEKINLINIKLKYKNYSDINDVLDKNSITILNDYIYKYTLKKDDINTNIYHLSRNNITSINTFSRTLSSCWFLNTL